MVRLGVPIVPPGKDLWKKEEGVHMHTYANTQIRKYTNTQIHKYANTQIRTNTNTQIHKYAWW